VSNVSQADSDAPATPAGLVAGYNLDETTGGLTIHDVTGRNDGTASTASGSPGHVAGRYGNGLEAQVISSNYQAVRIPTSPSLEQLGNELTLAAWVKVATTTNVAVALMSKHLVFSWLVVPQGGSASLQLSINNPNVFGGTVTVASPSGVVPLGQWTHLAATAKAGRVKFYVDGALVGDVAASLPSTFNQPGTLFLMCSNHVGTDCSSFQYLGLLDDAGIWSRALSQAEVQTAMNTPLSTMDRLGDACDPCPTNADRTCAPSTCLDRDGDGYGVQGASACGSGRTATFDCNDGDPAIHVGAAEVCDGIDNNCDGRVDENCLQSPRRTVYSYNAFNQLLTYGPPRVCATGDVDCDGVPDAQDNCPFIANPGQQNSDGSTPNANGAGATALWSFNEGIGGTVADGTGQYNGTVVGSPQWVPGFSGKALDFQGSTSNFVTQSSLAGPGAPFSLEAKVNLRSNGSGVLARWSTLAPNWSISAGGVGVAFMNPQGNLPLGRWVHVAFTFDGTTSRYYQDGTEVAASSEHPWASGGHPLQMGEGLSGALDEVAVFPRALSAAEVQHHGEGLFGDKLGDACDPCPDNADPTCAPTTCTDQDGDGYGPQGASAWGGAVDKFDCNDGDGSIHPGVRMCATAWTTTAMAWWMRIARPAPLR
jgi:hypothetical protein